MLFECTQHKNSSGEANRVHDMLTTTKQTLQRQIYSFMKHKGIQDVREQQILFLSINRIDTRIDRLNEHIF